MIRTLVAWGKAFQVTLAVHEILRQSGRRDESLVDDVAHPRGLEGGAARLN